MLKPFDPSTLERVGSGQETQVETQKPNSTPSSPPLKLATAKAVQRLLGFYPPLDVGDPKVFTAGLVTLFGQYPAEVVKTALDPVRGIPAHVDALRSIAAVKVVLDKICEPYDDALERERAAESHRRGLPPPLIETTPESKARVAALHAEAKSALGPSPAKGGMKPDDEGDGRHARRIAADLAARAVRNRMLSDSSAASATPLPESLES